MKQEDYDRFEKELLDNGYVRVELLTGEKWMFSKALIVNDEGWEELSSGYEVEVRLNCSDAVPRFISVIPTVEVCRDCTECINMEWFDNENDLDREFNEELSRKFYEFICGMFPPKKL